MSANDNVVSRKSDGTIAEGAAVKMKSNGKVVETTADTEEVYGIAQTSTSGADEDVSIQIDGRYDLALVDGSGTSISDGDDLMPGADGKLQSHDGNAGEVFAAMALEDSSADGDRISVKIYDGTITA